MKELVNISGGNLHLTSLGFYLVPGGRYSFGEELYELLVRAPEISLYLERKRAIITDLDTKDINLEVGS